MNELTGQPVDGLRVAAPAPNAGRAHGSGAAREEWRQHWRVGLASLLGFGLGTGLMAALFSLFIAPLQQSFGWSRGEIAMAFSANLATAIALPVLGRLMDRVGVRRLVLPGMMLTAGFYLGLASMPKFLPLFYVLFCGLVVSGCTTSGLVFARVVSAQFVKSRGLSLAITRSGLSITNMLMPGILFLVIQSAGWRGGYVFLALLIIFISLPAAWLWIERDGAMANIKREEGRAEPLPLIGLLKNRHVLTIALAAALGYAPALAIQSQLQPLLVSKGMTPAFSAVLIGAIGASGLIGAIVTGALIDRFWAPMVALIFAVGSAMGCSLLLLDHPAPAIMIGAILLLGLGQGAEVDVVAFMVARYFGMSSFGSIYGVTTFAITLSMSLFSILIGKAFDYFGNYDVPIIIAASSFILAGLLYLSLGRYPDQAK